MSPGAGNIIVPAAAICIGHFVTANYAGTGTARYELGGAQHWDAPGFDIATGFFDGNVDEYGNDGPFLIGSGGDGQPLSTIDGEPLVLNATQPFANGDSTVDLTVYYALLSIT